MASILQTPNIEKAKTVLHFMHLAEKLKCVLRHGWTSTGRQESVAEHSWRISLLVMACSSSLDSKINLEKTLKMALIHDIAEAITGDIPYFLAPEGSKKRAEKVQNEKIAINAIKEMFRDVLGPDWLNLWLEYEECKSYEAKVVKALDKIEAQIQQNEADPSTWLECEEVDATNGYIKRFSNFDAFLSLLSNEVINESKEVSENL